MAAVLQPAGGIDAAALAPLWKKLAPPGWEVQAQAEAAAHYAARVKAVSSQIAACIRELRGLTNRLGNLRDETVPLTPERRNWATAVNRFLQQEPLKQWKQLETEALPGDLEHAADALVGALNRAYWLGMRPAPASAWLTELLALAQGKLVPAGLESFVAAVDGGARRLLDSTVADDLQALAAWLDEGLPFDAPAALVHLDACVQALVDALSGFQHDAAQSQAGDMALRRLLLAGAMELSGAKGELGRAVQEALSGRRFQHLPERLRAHARATTEFNLRRAAATELGQWLAQQPNEGLAARSRWALASKAMALGDQLLSGLGPALSEPAIGKKEDPNYPARYVFALEMLNRDQVLRERGDAAWLPPRSVVAGLFHAEQGLLTQVSKFALKYSREFPNDPKPNGTRWPDPDHPSAHLLGSGHAHEAWAWVQRMPAEDRNPVLALLSVPAHFVKWSSWLGPEAPGTEALCAVLTWLRWQLPAFRACITPTPITPS